jgi:hypothetical protein
LPEIEGPIQSSIGNDISDPTPAEKKYGFPPKKVRKYSRGQERAAAADRKGDGVKCTCPGLCVTGQAVHQQFHSDDMNTGKAGAGSKSQHQRPPETFHEQCNAE